MSPRLFSIPEAQLLAAFGAIVAVLYAVYHAATLWKGDRKRAATYLVGGGAVAYLLVRHVVLDDSLGEAPIPIYSYGFMIMLGFASAILLCAERGKLFGLDPDKMMDLGLCAMIGGVAGSRIFHVIQYWNSPEGGYAGDPWKIVMIWKGGIVFYGGLIGAFLLCTWFLRRHRMPYWVVADVVAPTIALGEAFARVGCFLNGCCFGNRTDSFPFAVTFPPESPAFHHHREHDWIAAGADASLPVVPTQILSSLGTMLLFGLLLVYSAKWARRTGETFFLYLLLYGPLRFGLETLRDDTPQDWPLGLNAGEFVSLPIVAAGLVGFVLARAGRLPGSGPVPAPLGAAAPAGPATAPLATT